jgi:DNA-binding response OmpR family regulator
MKKTVLIVEDHTVHITLMFRLIEGLCTIVFARTIKSAQELINQRCPDLILLDNQLPDGRGIDFCRVLKNDSRTKQTPVILVTGDSDEETEIAAFDAGASDFIAKPVAMKTALARIKKFL